MKTVGGTEYLPRMETYHTGHEPRLTIRQNGGSATPSSSEKSLPGCISSYQFEKFSQNEPRKYNAALT